MIYLDTHVVVWLYCGLTENLPATVQELLESNDIFISPILMLELSYLHETKRISVSAEVIIKELKSKIDLSISDTSFEDIVDKANHLNWTRDPFDRIIVANAMCHSATLITKDKNIHKHYKMAVW